MRSLLMGAVVAVAGAGAASAQERADATENLYPTVAVADYVLGCMAANGNTRDALERCSCSIDVLSTILPYEDYVAAEGFLRMGHVVGERGAIFRDNEQSKEAIGALRRAQIEAELRCF